MRRDVRSHEDLEVWKMAMMIAADVYRLTADMPREERFGLRAQLRGAAVSVPANIAEGAARDSTADFARFLSIAAGSLSELDTELVLGEELGFLKYSVELRNRIKLTRVMLSRLRRSLRSKIFSARQHV
jgi:four helix bundle protein